MNFFEKLVSRALMIGVSEAIPKFEDANNSISPVPDSQLPSIETKLFKGIELKD